MKTLCTFMLLLAFTCANAQHSIEKLWQTDTVLATPESVLPHGNILFVSLIDGNSNAKDGKGGVAKLTTEGKVIDTAWITGLSAPKGMGVWGNTLYVADLDDLVLIDIKAGKIKQKLKIDGATGMNDVTVDSRGIVYVSDPKSARVFRVENGVGTMYLDNLKGVNGVKAVGTDLYVLTADAAYKADATKNLTKVCMLEHGGDGVEPIGNGDMLMTAWVGYLYYVKTDGTKEILLDTHDTRNKTADIGYDAKKRIIYVPTFFGKSVVAYRLK